MLSSIHPFGERSRNSRWWLTVTAYLVGSVLGGATTGAAAGFIGATLDPLISPTLAGVVFAACCLLGFGIDSAVVPLHYPSWHRQVNEVWLTSYRGWVYGLGFGFQLGLGVVTIITTATVWLTWLAAVLVGTWWMGLVIGIVFGAARGSLILATAPVHGPEQLRALHRNIAASAATVGRAARIVAGSAGVATIVALAQGAA